MPQAQPELKKVRYTPYHSHTRPKNRENRRTRPQHDGCLETTREGESKKEKWTDPRLQYLDKRLFVQLNGSRKVIGVLRGYDVGFGCPALWERFANMRAGLLEYCVG